MYLKSLDSNTNCKQAISNVMEEQASPYLSLARSVGLWHTSLWSVFQLGLSDKIQHHLVEWQVIDHHFVRHQDGGLDVRLGEVLDVGQIGRVGGICAAPAPSRRACGCDRWLRALWWSGRVSYSRSSRSRITSRCKSAAKAKGHSLHLGTEGRVVELQLLDRVAQILEIIGTDRKEAAEDPGHFKNPPEIK